jgi:hypothetical protein
LAVDIIAHRLIDQINDDRTPPGTQFACFTGTKVQILTQMALCL